MSYDPKRSTYLNPNIEYLFNDEIIEYDMKDAGFSLIKQFKLLTPEQIRELERLDKGLERHIAVGKLQGKDKEFSNRLGEKFAEVRGFFIEFNGLNDNNILSVKKDAIYTIGSCKRLKFGQVQFSPKNNYTSYIRFPNIQNIEIYYSYMGIDVKGMSDSAVNRHRLYMMEFLKNIISMMETKNSRVKRYLIQFIDSYKSGELDEGYYLEFNNTSNKINPLFNFQNIIIPLIHIVGREV